MTEARDQSPINPLPPVVVALALLIFGIELIFQAGARGLAGGPAGVGWRIAALRDYGFSGDVLRWMLQTGHWPPEHLRRLVTYPFVHANFTHALMVIVFLLALGKMVGETLGAVAVLVVFFTSAIFGALVYTAVWAGAPLLVGGYPAVYGLIGAYTLLLWLQLGHQGQARISAFRLIALLMGVQLAFGLLFGGGQDWVADLAGFVNGFAVSFALVPGSLRRFMDRLRQR